MDFPVLGDADVYTSLGKSCADLIMSGGGETSTCFDSIRPVGMVLYQTIPFLMTSDTIEQNYITLLLNIACLVVLIASLLVLFRNLSFETSGQKHWVDYVAEAAIVAFTLVLCVAYIPVRLSDIQSFTFFVASVAMLSNEDGRKKTSTLIVAGLMAGLAVLMKQNYLVSIFFLVFFWFCFDFKEQIKNKFKYVFLYLCGVSICLMQVVFVYHNAGVLWFYDPKAMEIFAPTNAQPYVELIAYTDPVKGSYVSQLQMELSALQYTALKFYEGMTKFYLSVYLGKAPLEETPVAVTVGSAKLLFMQLFLFVAVLITLATAFFKNKWMSIVSFMVMSSVFVTAALAHTENRYYLMVKIFCVLISVAVLVKVAKNHFIKVSD